MKNYKENITKGVWFVKDFFRRPEIHSDSTNGRLALITETINDRTDDNGVEVSTGQSHRELMANAQLIAEAGTVFNETGLTPREMQKEIKSKTERLGNFMDKHHIEMVARQKLERQNKELLEALKTVHKTMW